MRQTGTFGPNLTRLRHARMSVERLAAKVDMDPDEIRVYESGQGIPTMRMVMAFGRALELDLRERHDLLDAHRATLAMTRAHSWTRASHHPLAG